MLRLIQNLALASSVVAIAGCSSMGGMHGSNASQSAVAQQAKLADKAQTVLQRQMSQSNAKRIPSQLIADARCIGVFPSVVKAGFIVGGQHGRGLVTCRQESGGFKSANPAVFSLSSGSIGLQAGAQKSSVILLFETRQSVDALWQSHIKLGSQIAVTAGPSGYNHPITHVPAPIVAYVLSQKGLYAGIDFSGTKLSFVRSANASLYGASATARGVLLGSMQPAAALASFKQTLQQFTPTASSNSEGNSQQQQQSGSNPSQSNGQQQQSSTNPSQANGGQQQPNGGQSQTSGGQQQSSGGQSQMNGGQQQSGGGQSQTQSGMNQSQSNSGQ
ncbi:lipid-binding SYLF domain-containing protein [Salinisphaera sp.]|uniref:lipid-binding SYLF domain-containing protein n=1 Tax=Salinisphaera sp. TaxID=1914330 RepID=UPI002D784201|nr:lipid-binding SYLF domain-containing protein [Salinisphaera sp.]HET7315562.1 lipid-binding SYLF domain-containing protein [Salinisphaera sp.]